MKSEELKVKNGLPSGWVYAFPEEIGSVFTGRTPSKSNNEFYGDKFPLYKPTDLNGDNYNLKIASDYLSNKGLKDSRFIPKNSILVTCIASIGKIGFSRLNGSCNQQINAIVPCKKYIYSEYIYFYTLSEGYQEVLKNTASATTVPILNKSKFNKIPIKLPPLSEQKRIVAKIEKLFSNLDNSDKYLLHLEKQLKRYRQSVLKSAFEGELTKEWREKQTNLETADELLENIKKERILYIENEIREKFKDKPEKWIKDKINSGIKKYLESLIILRNDILPKSWSETFLQCLTFEHTQDIVDGPFGSNLKASEYQESGIPIVRLQNIDRNIFIDKNIQFVSEKKAEQLKRHSYKQGDIVITKLGAPLGKACIIPDTIDDGIIVADVVRLRLFEKYFDKKYVSYFINSNYPISQLEVLVKGTTRPRVNLTHIRELRVYICSILEQQEIVNQIEKHFSIIDKLEVVVQQSIKESKRLRQSILKQAFEGKLVEQDPNDESASILLEKIAKAKEEYQKAQKKQVRKK